MKLNIRDVIKLEDNNEYAVASVATLNDVVYYYLIDLNKDDNIKFGYLEDDNFINVEDKDLIKQLLPLFNILNN